MADVEMADAGPSAPAKAKAPGTKVAKAGGADVGGEPKKKFEVKKVGFSMRTRHSKNVWSKNDRY